MYYVKFTRMNRYVYIEEEHVVIYNSYSLKPLKLPNY